jgi:hypothetical protein
MRCAIAAKLKRQIDLQMHIANKTIIFTTDFYVTTTNQKDF